MRGDKECIDEDNEAYEERLREAVRRTVLLQILRISGTSMAPAQTRRSNEIFQSICNNAEKNKQSIVESRGQELALEYDVNPNELIVQYVRVMEEEAATATNSNDINLDDSIESIGSSIKSLDGSFDSFSSDDDQRRDDDVDDSFSPSPFSDGSTNEQQLQAEAKIDALREDLATYD